MEMARVGSAVVALNAWKAVVHRRSLLRMEDALAACKFDSSEECLPWVGVLILSEAGVLVASPELGQIVDHPWEVL